MAEPRDPAARPQVALIGLRCAGKSSVGRRLAELLGLDFADLDRELVLLHQRERCGGRSEPRSAGELLAELGEPAFRVLEERALRELLERPAARVIATGGGAVESAASRDLLRARCTCIWLFAEPAVLRARLAADPPARPALTAAGALAEVEALARRREPLYRELAELALDSSRASVEELALELARRLRARAAENFGTSR